MHLKRLEISGFKSFADRVELAFGPGVTGVVGPNGSGKSNIVDAIRFVLGESNARELRGVKTEDVVFSGSEGRRPVGLAEVSLTFDNTDASLPVEYTEVTITRRVNRSGESDYFLNRTPVRLRDVHELFLDTGVGKEGYSVIGQGRVEEVLAAKSEDRRGVFEEAAGIAKYKARKKEAEKKLADNDGNLIRLGDVIAELENQITELEPEYRRALLYKTYQDELSRLELDLSLDEYASAEKAMEQVVHRTDGLRQRLAEQTAVSTKLEADFATQGQVAVRAAEETEGIRAGLAEAQAAVERLKGEKALLVERAASAAREAARLEEDRQQLRTQLAEDEGPGQDLAARLEDVEKRLVEAEKARQEAEAQLATVEAARGQRVAEIEKAKNEIFDLMNAAAQAQGRAKQAETRVAVTQGEAARLRAQAAERQKNREAQAGEEKETREKLAAAEAALTREGARLEQARKRRAEAQRLREQKRSESHQAQLEVRDLLSRLEVLEQMEEHLEGYQQGPRTVLAANRGGSAPGGGIRGPVADLITVAPEYRLAVETALGQAVQNIVIDTEAEARKIIAWLRRTGQGRATFLPLDTVKPRPWHGPRPDDPGVVGVAVDLVRFDPVIRPAIENLLGNILVTQNLEAAVRVGRRAGFSFRAVTLEGDVLHPGGALTGGSQPSRSDVGLLARKDAQSRLEKEITEGRRRVAALEKALAEAAAQVAAAENELSEADGARSRAVAELEVLKGATQAAAARGASLQRDVAELEMDAQRLSEETRHWAGVREKEAASAGEIEAQLTLARQSLAEQEATQRSGEEEVRSCASKVSDFRVNEARLAQEKDGLRAEIRGHQERRAAVERRLAALAEQTAARRCDIERLGEETAAVERRLADTVDLVASKEEQLAAAGAARREAEERLATIEREVRQANRTVLALQQRFSESEVEQARLESVLARVRAHLTDQFGMGEAELGSRKVFLKDRQLTIDLARQQRARLAELGPTNLAVIPEYERISARRDFLKQQCLDLEQAGAVLRRIIGEMEAVMREKFMERFRAISAQFELLFQKLFGGGRAELRLSDEGNVLESGIDILAQPPGKTLQNLALLSGGERALTAGALLFAVLAVKPSPFCVMDEIDAALDDLNVHRFAETLKEFSDATQFIVVTHQKRTMESADVLYGITMEEAGVSRVVSVRLSEAAAEAGAVGGRG